MFRGELCSPSIVTSTDELPLPPQTQSARPEEPIAEERESRGDQCQSNKQCNRDSQHDRNTHRTQKTKTGESECAKCDDYGRAASRDAITGPRDRSLNGILLSPTQPAFLRITAYEEDAVVGSRAEHGDRKQSQDTIVNA